MRGTENVHVEVVAHSTGDLTTAPQRLRALGLQVGDETMVRSKRTGGTGVFDATFEH